MADRESGGFWKDLFRPGTVACALLCGVLGIAIAVCVLLIGFWKTVLIVAFFAIGWTLGRSDRLRVLWRKLWARLVQREL